MSVKYYYTKKLQQISNNYTNNSDTKMKKDHNVSGVLGFSSNKSHLFDILF